MWVPVANPGKGQDRTWFKRPTEGRNGYKMLSVFAVKKGNRRTFRYAFTGGADEAIPKAGEIREMAAISTAPPSKGATSPSASS